MATGAPLLPVFVLLEGRDRFRLITLPPMHFDDSLEEGMRRMARAMEQVVAQHPTQWFNFFDVWPAAS